MTSRSCFFPPASPDVTKKQGELFGAFDGLIQSLARFSSRKALRATSWSFERSYSLQDVNFSPSLSWITQSNSGRCGARVWLASSENTESANLLNSGGILSS